MLNFELEDYGSFQGFSDTNMNKKWVLDCFFLDLWAEDLCEKKRCWLLSFG